MHILSLSNKFLSTVRRGVAALVVSAIGFSQVLMPVQAGHVDQAVTSSSLDANWPSGPSVSSEAAILIEAETGTILYEKNAYQQMYPASITKILTTLIAYETCELDETVTFTQEALATIPYDSSRIWVDRGEYMSMEDCLAAILIMSANDVAAGVAEHIGGTLEAFADIMNKRAEELGCLNSHFMNSHGYHDPEHYTTAYDMAQIGRAFFEIDLLCTFAKERNFKHGPTEGQPDPIDEWNQNKLLATRTYEYEYLVGSKTGYTSDAGQTLISCAQKDGMKLICVVMNAVKPEQYKDTISLFDFGFSNFTTANISENDTTYVSAESSYGMDVTDVLGDSTPLLSMNKDAIIVLPKTASFADTTSYIAMNTEEENCMAVAHYQYGTHDIGNVQIYVTATADAVQESEGALDQIVETAPVEEPEETAPVFVNLLHIVLYIAGAALAIFILFVVYRLYMNHRNTRTPSVTGKRRSSSSLNGLKTVFISFAQFLQALWYFIIGCFTSASKRKRYKKRGSASVMSQKNNQRNVTLDRDLRSARSTSKEYYTKASNTKPKNVVFHELNDPK